MADALLQRDSGLILRPVDGLSERELERFPMRRPLKVKIVRARSNPNLRHYWACLHAFEDATGKCAAAALHELLKIECGLTTAMRLANGEIRLVPDSIAFERLDEQDFIQFKRNAFNVIRVNFGVEPTALQRAGVDLLGGADVPF